MVTLANLTILLLKWQCLACATRWPWKGRSTTYYAIPLSRSHGVDSLRNYSHQVRNIYWLYNFYNSLNCRSWTVGQAIVCSTCCIIPLSWYLHGYWGSVWGVMELFIFLCYYFQTCRLVEVGQANVCCLLVLVTLSASMLCYLQLSGRNLLECSWEKEENSLLKMVCSSIVKHVKFIFYNFLLVRDNWEEVCDMSKPIIHKTISGEMNCCIGYSILWTCNNHTQCCGLNCFS